MNASLKGKSILITGGGSGIGEGAARYLAAQGARVTISGRRAERIRAVAESLGPLCHWVDGDVCLSADRQRMLDAALAHGGGTLFGLINNAGITHHSGLDGLDEASLSRVMATNVHAPLFMTQLAVDQLARSQGCVIFIGSVHTRLALPGRLAYAASKGAIVNASRVLAAELGARKVRVNCVIPGAVATEINAAVTGQDPQEAKAFFRNLAHLHPIGRIGEPEDIAQAMAYLLLADWTTGAVLDVDGGMGLGYTKL
ncbi:MAG: SDR family oxidoreductase [Comamonadaceae bacterium]|nr:SDR family oxidoreductase [Comamonadaceae bacterium]